MVETIHKLIDGINEIILEAQKEKEGNIRQTKLMQAAGKMLQSLHEICEASKLVNLPNEAMHALTILDEFFQTNTLRIHFG